MSVVNQIILGTLHGYIDKTIDDASEELGISRTTFVRDMDKVCEWFRLHQVELQRGQKRGFYLDIDEITRRSLLVAFIIEHTSANSFFNSYLMHDQFDSKVIQDYCKFSSINQLYRTVDFGKLFNILDDYLESIQITVTDNTFTWLIYYLAVMITRIKEGEYIQSLPENYNQFDGLDEYNKIKDVLKSQILDGISESDLHNEAIFITGRLFASAKNGRYATNEENSEIANRIYSFILDKICQRIGCDIYGIPELADGLKTHLQAVIIRAQLKILTYNAMLDEIKRRFTELFDECSAIAEEVNEIFGLRLDENEVGFIVLYVVAAMEQMHKNVLKPTTVRAVLVCGYGLGTVSLLMNSLDKRFPNIEIVDKLPIFALNKYDFSKVDVVLSTIEIPLNLLKPTIKVSPIITKLDIRRIDSFLRNGRITAKDSVQEFRMRELLGIINENCEIRDTKNLVEKLGQMLSSYTDVPQTITSLPTLPDILLKKNMVANIEARTWEEAVLKAAQPLLDNHCIAMEYIDKIYEMKNSYGQYSVISPGVCMPHASPCENNKLAMSVGTLKEPVQIIADGEIIDIHVFMVIALVDSITHAKALDEVFILFDEFPDLVDELSRTSSTSDISYIFKTYYNRLF